MRFINFAGGFWVLFLTGIWLSATQIAQAQTQTPPAGIPAHQRIISYAGPETCLECHPEAGKQVAESLHYQVEGYSTTAENSEGQHGSGWLGAYWIPGATAASINWIEVLQPQDALKLPQPGGCALCHTSLGFTPNPLNELSNADFTNIDCLMCHGPGYARRVVKTGEREGNPVYGFAPGAGVDIIQVAQAAIAPTDEMCLRCHADVEVNGMPTENLDVHTALGMPCRSCHMTSEHKITGAQVECANCHTAHKQISGMINGLGIPANAVLDQHSEYIACQTCHIPQLAHNPDMPSVTRRDFAVPMLDEESGLYAAQDVHATVDLRPEYAWWNGERLSSELQNERAEDSVITPWIRTTYNIPVDTSLDTPLPIKTGVYGVSGDLEAAVAAGVEAWRALNPDFRYSGAYRMAEASKPVRLTHQVSPANEALDCTACHTRSGGRLDFIALGYSPDQAALLANFPPLAPTLQATATQPPPTGTPNPTPEPAKETPEPTARHTEPSALPVELAPSMGDIWVVLLFLGVMVLTALAIYANTGKRMPATQEISNEK